jgi:protein SCO1
MKATFHALRWLFTKRAGFIFFLIFQLNISTAENLQTRVDKTVSSFSDIPLVSMNEKSTSLKSELELDTPVIVNFVFTTCSTICSVQTLVLAQAIEQFDSSLQSTRLVTFTIDPDNDTPRQLRKFASAFNIPKNWMFYTGAYESMLAIQKTFNVYRGSKSNHPPVMFMRRSKSAPWVRVDGFPKAQEIVAQLRTLPNK